MIDVNLTYQIGRWGGHPYGSAIHSGRLARTALSDIAQFRPAGYCSGKGRVHLALEPGTAHGVLNPPEQNLVGPSEQRTLRSTLAQSVGMRKLKSSFCSI